MAAGLAIASCLAASPLVAQASMPPDAAETDAEAGPDHGAAVTIGGETVVWVPRGIGPYTAEVRAERIASRIDQIVHDRSLTDPVVAVVESEMSSELRVGPRLVMVITTQDAKAMGSARVRLAEQYAQEVTAAIRAERQRRDPQMLLRSAGFAALATVLFVAVAWGSRRLMRHLRQWFERLRARRLGTLRVKDLEVVSAHRLTRALDRLVAGVRALFLLAALDAYLTYVLGLFPWTRAVSFRLVDYVVRPLSAAAAAFVGYLPNLLFVIVIGLLIHLAIRSVGFFFEHIASGRLTFTNFPPEWAAPTNQIARVLLIAFGLVVAFPYLPASNSPAFAGVSVFMGVLLSLASSSSLSNMIAGLMLVYTGAFKLGDRVRIAETFGDIVETSLLSTRIRTIKNEEVTLPNTLVISSAVTNYSKSAQSLGLIVHTSITIGYDVPWRTVHGLLLEAARHTPALLAEPAPFVWQTALNDFYITYELNAYTNRPGEMAGIYAALHANIQDAFCNAGVEIMSPHYTSLRDGDSPTTPPPVRAQSAVEQDETVAR